MSAIIVGETLMIFGREKCVPNTSSCNSERPRHAPVTRVDRIFRVYTGQFGERQFSHGPVSRYVIRIALLARADDTRANRTRIGKPRSSLPSAIC